MRRVPFFNSTLKPIFLITVLDEISITIGFPLLTFLCFDQRSRLFVASASHATRSIWYGTLSASPHIVAIFSAPLLSFLSDHWGRKKLLMIGAFGALIYALVTTTSILFGSLTLLLVGSLVYGVSARTQPIALAVVGDLSDAKDKKINMGYLQVAISVGAFLGPMIGGYFATRFLFPTFNFSLPYIIAAIAGMFTVLLTQCYFKETYKPAIKEKFALIAPLKSLMNPQVLNISIILILTQISWRFYYQFVPPILKLHSNYSPTLVGFFLALIAVWLIIASGFGIRFLDKFFSAKKIMQYGCYAMLLGLVMMIVSVHLHGVASDWFAWGSAIPISMGDVIVYSMITTFYSDAASRADQGKIMGLNFIIVSVVWSVTGLAGGFLAAANINLPIYVAAAVLVLLFVFEAFACQ